MDALGEPFLEEPTTTVSIGRLVIPAHLHSLAHPKIQIVTTPTMNSGVNLLVHIPTYRRFFVD